MKSKASFWRLAAPLVPILFGQAATAAVINVLPGTNNVPIQRVVYTINGSDVIQNSEHPSSGNGVSVASDTPVNVKSVRVDNSGTIVNLEYINTLGATVLNVNPQFLTITRQTTSPSPNDGIGVFDNGAVTKSTGGLAAFATAVAATTTDSDLRNFTYYDFLSSTPTPGVPDYDLLYVKAMLPDDYVLVSERFGNTFFEVTPLGADGNPIAGANTLRFGGNGGAGYAVYDWNSGYAAGTNNPTQAQAFSVASVNKFFEGTSVTPTAVYGFRIDNDGEADTKILIMGNNPFTDNPNNPILVPEPSSALLVGLAGLGLVFRRRRETA